MNENRKRILIADCDTEVLIALERVLEDDGFETTTACTTAETLGWLRKARFDLVLAADHPPELDCELLLRDPLLSNPKTRTPLVALEHVPRHPFVEQYLLSLGARRVVHKWEHQEVRDVVREVLVRRSGEAAKSAVAGTAILE